jgi:hypothetical protein
MLEKASLKTLTLDNFTDFEKAAFAKPSCEIESPND